MDCPSIAYVAGPASSSVPEHALDAHISKHDEHEPMDVDIAAAPVVKVAQLTNDTFERVDSVMNEDDDAVGPTTTVVPPKDSEFASVLPSVASMMPVAKAMDVAKDSGVRIVGLHEWKAASLSLAEAFEKDHSSLYFLDTPERAHWTSQQKWDLHLKIMEYITADRLPRMPPGRNTDSTLTTLRSGLWRLNYLLCREGRKRFFTEFLPLLTDTKSAVLGPALDNDSWYLVYIGTRPLSRGNGYARKVIEHVTRIADRDAKCCYLESSHAVNRQIYAKMGFAMVKNIYLQRAEEHVELDIMVRAPVPGSKM
nr:putative n-acetyltransferase [Quercus suber]